MGNSANKPAGEPADEPADEDDPLTVIIIAVVVGGVAVFFSGGLCVYCFMKNAAKSAGVGNPPIAQAVVVDNSSTHIVQAEVVVESQTNAQQAARCESPS